LDNNPSNYFILNDYFSGDINSYKSGSILFPLQGMSPGTHTIKVKAWDISNNSVERSIEFVVDDDTSPKIFRVYNYPNPAVAYTTFGVEHNLVNKITNIKFEIFDITGRLIESIKQDQFRQSGYTFETSPWNMTSFSGSTLTNGIYYYHCTLEYLDEDSNKITISSNFNKLIFVQ